MPHCHRAGAPKSDKRPRPLQQMDQTAHCIAHSCCCPNSEPPHCLATQVNAISPQQSAQRSHSEDCIGHWCSHPNTRWCHRTVERWSGTHPQRSQQTTQTARCIALECCCPNTPPSHQDQGRGKGEGVLLPGGHCCEQSIRGVKNAVGVGSPAHQRASFLTKDRRGGDRQYNRRKNHEIEYDNQKAVTQETACPIAARSPRQRKTAAQRTAVQFGLVAGRPNQGQVGHRSAMA